MTLRWKYSIFALALILLAGCYRQADEQLQPITNPTSIPAVPDTGSTATTEPVLSPEETEFPATSTLPPITVIQPQSTDVPLVTDTALPDVPTKVNITADAAMSQVTLMPTATAAVITPGGPGGLVSFDTLTPTVGTPATATPSGLITPTTLFIEDDECSYTVQSGDNLFRIAINNDTTLEALRAANPDIVGDIIQPGQTLTIPDCTAGSTASVDTSAITSVPDSITVPDVESSGISGSRIHTVQSGETLMAIARQYGVTIQDIVDANSLANPDTLSVGQELIIP